MPRYLNEPAYRHGSPAKTAVVLVNLGTPDAPTPSAVRRYLKQFLSDPRVVEIPKPIWWLILNGIILNTRPRRSAAKYASIWTPNGSPLRVHTERQAALLADKLAEQGHRLEVTWAMRYGTPSIADTLSRLKAQGIVRYLILPMYPQYAASTTATVIDDWAAWMSQTRNQPECRSVRHFHDDPAYIAALEHNVRTHWQNHAPLGPKDHLLISFHGLPQRSLELGDPYYCECQKTGRLLAERLQLTPEQYTVSFQSRFGRARWLQPYTAPTLHTLAQTGTQRVDVICPGFVADCLETLEEINLEARSEFLAAGGQAFHYIPALNDSPLWIDALAQLATRHLQGWPTQTEPDANTLAASARAAHGLGATQ